MNTQIQSPQQTNIKQKMEIVQALALFPAITVMVFIRRKIGFRMLKPSWLLVMSAIMIAVALILGPIAGPFRSVMFLYGLGMLTLGLIQRYKRWNGLCAGERWHSYCPGISSFESLPLPPALKSHRRIQRFLDPILCVVIGIIVGLFLSRGLGLWIAFAGLALYIFEQNIYEKALERDLDILDGFFAAEVQEETVKHFENPTVEQGPRPLEATCGIPTGLAPDIAYQIEARRASQSRGISNSHESSEDFADSQEQPV